MTRQDTPWSVKTCHAILMSLAVKEEDESDNEDLEFTWEDQANIELGEPLCHNYKKKIFGKRSSCLNMHMSKEEFVTGTMALIKLEKGLCQTYFKQFLSASPNPQWKYYHQLAMS